MQSVDTNKQKAHWAMSWGEVDLAVGSLILDIKARHSTEVKTIVGIAKGGLIPATMVWQAFPEAKFVVLQTSSYTPQGKVPPRILNPEVLVHQIPDNPTTLIVDDICDSGDTFRTIDRHVNNVMFAAMLIRDHPEGSDKIFEYDYMGRTVAPGVWVDFPWERRTSEEVEVAF